MDAELFEAPFNLSGESQSGELTAEAEARVRALAEAEARKAQTLLFTEHDCPECGEHFSTCVCDQCPSCAETLEAGKPCACSRGD